MRNPPQNARRPPGATTSAVFVKPVQPVWIGLLAPILPARVITVWLRSSVFGPVGWCHATWSTPSPVRASPTWSVLEPSGVVSRFQGAALAGAVPQAAIRTATTTQRTFMERPYRRDTDAINLPAPGALPLAGARR